MAERQPCHERESHVHSIRSTCVKRRRGRRDRLTTASWCRSARISRCSETRDRTMNRSEWSSEKTEATKRGYRRTSVTSIDATRTVFSTARGWQSDLLQMVEQVRRRVRLRCKATPRARGREREAETDVNANRFYRPGSWQTAPWRVSCRVICRRTAGVVM